MDNLIHSELGVEMFEIGQKLWMYTEGVLEPTPVVYNGIEPGFASCPSCLSVTGCETPNITQHPLTSDGLYTSLKEALKAQLAWLAAEEMEAKERLAMAQDYVYDIRTAIDDTLKIL
jgi:hypothetical protein